MPPITPPIMAVLCVLEEEDDEDVEVEVGGVVAVVWVKGLELVVVCCCCCEEVVVLA